MRCAAALLYLATDGPGGGTAAISGRSGAVVLGIEQPPDCPVEVTVTDGRRVRVQGLVVVRSALFPGDIVAWRGLMMTVPARTVFDIARRLPRDDSVPIIDALLHRHLTTVSACRDYLRTHAASRGCRRVADVLSVVDLRAESPMESRLRLRIVDGGLPCPESQVEVWDGQGRFVARLDLAYRDRRIGIEYEGDHHRDRATFRRDIARVNALQSLGWTIVRATVDDIRHPERFLATLRALLDR